VKLFWFAASSISGHLAVTVTYFLSVVKGMPQAFETFSWVTAFSLMRAFTLFQKDLTFIGLCTPYYTFCISGYTNLSPRGYPGARC
jgi:hypothetical protein